EPVPPPPPARSCPPRGRVRSSSTTSRSSASTPDGGERWRGVAREARRRPPPPPPRPPLRRLRAPLARPAVARARRRDGPPLPDARGGVPGVRARRPAVLEPRHLLRHAAPPRLPSGSVPPADAAPRSPRSLPRLPGARPSLARRGRRDLLPLSKAS